MTHGRKVCNMLKEIRRQIADKNEIEYVTSECHFEGECKGTCPKCESELQYLENELHKRTQLGKAVAVAGISLGMVGTFSACNTPQQTNISIDEQEITTDTVNIDTNPAISTDSVKKILNIAGDILYNMGEVTFPHWDDTVKSSESKNDTTIQLDAIEIKEQRPLIMQGVIDPNRDNDYFPDKE